jgi:hypothetical protein
VATLLVLGIMTISMLFFIPLAVRMEWMTYLGIPLVILIGPAGVAILTRRFKAMFGGVLLVALFSFLLQSC